MKVTRQQLRQIIREAMEEQDAPSGAALQARMARWLKEQLSHSYDPIESAKDFVRVFDDDDFDVPVRYEDLQSFTDETTREVMQMLDDELQPLIESFVMIVYKQLMEPR